MTVNGKLEKIATINTKCYIKNRIRAISSHINEIFK